MSYAAAPAAKLLQLCPTLCDHIDSSPPGSSVPGILQARTLEWVGIFFSNACMHAKSHQSCLTLCDPMDSSPPGSSVPGFSRQKYWSGLPCPSPGNLSNPRIETSSPMSLVLEVESLPLSHQGSPKIIATSTLT